MPASTGKIWEKVRSQRDPPVLTVSGNPLATRHTHVTTTGCRQPDRSKRKGSQRDSNFVDPLSCASSLIDPQEWERECLRKAPPLSCGSLVG